MKLSGRIRLRFVGIAIPLLLAGLLSWMFYREWRQLKLERDLIQAIKRNESGRVIALLAARANPDARDGSLASISVWQLTLDRLRGLSRPTIAGPTALLVALEAQSTPNNRLTARHVQYTRIVCSLLSHGAYPNVRGPEGLTPLMMAAWTADIESLNALLNHGAQVNAESDHRGTAIQYATWAGSQQCIKALVARGALVGEQDADGNSALLGAADANRLDTLKYLLERGADPNSRNNAGTTALMLMVRNGNTAAVRLLLDSGADPNAADRMGRTSLYWLRHKPHSEMAVLLRTRGATR